MRLVEEFRLTFASIVALFSTLPSFVAITVYSAPSFIVIKISCDFIS